MTYLMRTTVFIYDNVAKICAMLLKSDTHQDDKKIGLPDKAKCIVVLTSAAVLVIDVLLLR